MFNDRMILIYNTSNSLFVTVYKYSNILNNNIYINDQIQDNCVQREQYVSVGVNHTDSFSRLVCVVGNVDSNISIQLLIPKNAEYMLKWNAERSDYSEFKWRHFMNLVSYRRIYLLVLLWNQAGLEFMMTLFRQKWKIFV